MLPVVITAPVAVEIKVGDVVAARFVSHCLIKNWSKRAGNFPLKIGLAGLIKGINRERKTGTCNLAARHDGDSNEDNQAAPNEGGSREIHLATSRFYWPNMPPTFDAMSPKPPAALSPAPPPMALSICPAMGAGSLVLRNPRTVLTAVRAWSSEIPVFAETCLMSSSMSLLLLNVATSP